MAYTNEAVTSYVVVHYSSGGEGDGRGRRSYISLVGAAGQRIGGLYFYEDPGAMPNEDSRNSTGFVYLHNPVSAYPHVLDLLRNESPVYLRYDDDRNRGWLATSSEPVGEEESP
ncbi:MAG: hypothetical protein AAGD35_01215 [Actinomycetota bacterium]